MSVIFIVFSERIQFNPIRSRLSYRLKVQEGGLYAPPYDLKNHSSYRSETLHSYSTT